MKLLSTLLLLLSLLGSAASAGGIYKTPNIDALAASGTRFKYCFAAPLCAASLAPRQSARLEKEAVGAAKQIAKGGAAA